MKKTMSFNPYKTRSKFKCKKSQKFKRILWKSSNFYRSKTMKISKEWSKSMKIWLNKNSRLLKNNTKMILHNKNKGTKQFYSKCKRSSNKLNKNRNNKNWKKTMMRIVYYHKIKNYFLLWISPKQRFYLLS